MRVLLKMLLMLVYGLLLSGCASELSLGIWNPVMSPDGREVAFVVYRANRPWVVGMVPVDPNDSSMTILDLPRDVNWSAVRYSSDGKRLLLRSLCAGAASECHDNAKGAHIWTANHDGSGLSRLTPDRVWGHNTPVFCEASDTVMYTAGPLGAKELGEVVILRTGGTEIPLTPHKPGNPFVPAADHPFRDINLPQQAHSDHFLFLASVDRTHPLYGAADPSPADESVKRVILEYESGNIRLARTEPSNVMANNGNPEVFACQHTIWKDGSPEVAEIRVSSFGKEFTVFSFSGFIRELSANDDFNRFAFLGKGRGRSASQILFSRNKLDVWVYDQALDTLYPLGIEERFLRLEARKQGEGPAAGMKP